MNPDRKASQFWKHGAPQGRGMLLLEALSCEDAAFGAGESREKVRTGSRHLSASDSGGSSWGSGAHSGVFSRSSKQFPYCAG